MRNIYPVLKKELSGYFATPLATVFIIIFLFLSSALTFYWGGFFARRQADLLPFFSLLPWLFLLFIPSLGMRLWAEENQNGTIELLKSLPIQTIDLVVGKFLAGWLFIGFALSLTCPLWLTVNYLGSPDNSVIIISYVGSWFTAGAMLAIASTMSALSKNQVIAFTLSVVMTLIFMLTNFPFIINFFRGWAGPIITDTLSYISILNHTSKFQRGVIDIRNVIYFVSFIVAWLLCNTFILEYKKQH